MTKTVLHLNLLRESERLSSSPVRLRVMLPMAALFACCGLVLWWGTLTTQLLIVKSQVSALREELEAKKNDHATILRQMARARDLRSELDQLTAYAHGRRTYGNLLARLAEVMPLKIQLISLSIPEPPPQTADAPRPGVRAPIQWGPTGTVENVSLRLVGRTPKETPVQTLMESLEAPAFTNELRVAERRPLIHSFRQDAAADGKNARLLVFDVEYACAERRFEK